MDVNNTDSPAGIADGEKRIAEIESRLSKIGDKRWFYNGYSQVCRDVGHDGYDKHDGLRDVAEQLFEKHGSCSTEFVHARYEAHQADPSVCFVPAEAGDTASGVHADTAEFIANSPSDIEWLIARLKRAEAERAQTRAEGWLCDDAAKILSASVGHPAIHWRTDGTMPHNAELMKVAASIAASRQAMINERDEEIKQLESERDRLREALEPFAKAAPLLEKWHDMSWLCADNESNDWPVCERRTSITVEDIRMAAAALADAGKGGGE